MKADVLNGFSNTRLAIPLVSGPARRELGSLVNKGQL